MMLKPRASGRRAQLRTAASSQDNDAGALEACRAGVAVRAPGGVHAMLTRCCHAQA
ncbi:hypothetical protein XOC_0754 [Xanthomonas oryzae pv. oryzicola BLS256]|uniref:Uncharacterized protein n=1 Tax=Xanthomonas oryzae pv. oryzicola (strain BLS256) TaxID=383407 RepID=G7TCH4_XANOB|nr:hypothetical protein XOC_0754 [Xanthomonas oryzae pv. oryzicola BLS256]